MKINVGAWIGIVVGLIGFIVAIGSVVTVAGPYAIYSAAGLLVMGVIMFYLFYKTLFAPVILAKRLRKTGIANNAVIKEVKDTGVTVNNCPQVKLVLELRNNSGQSYTTTIRTLISRLQPQLFQPGLVVPVLVDPENEKKIILDLDGRIYQDSSTQTNDVIERQLKDELTKLQEQQDILKITGTAARAIIKKYTWLGVNLNGNNPYAEMEMEVMPDAAPAFSATVKAVIKEESVAKYQPGEEIFVKYDRYDLKKVSIDHS